MKLKYKTLFLTIVPLALVLCLIGGLALNNKISTERELLSERIDSYRVLLESGDLTFETSADKDKLEYLLNEKVVFSEILDKNYNVIYSSENSATPLITENEKLEIKEAFEGIETSKYVKAKTGRETAFVISSPLIVNNRVVAVLHMGLSNEISNQRIKNYLGYISMFIIGGLLICSLLISLLLSKAVLKNIYSLKKATIEIQNGNLSAKINVRTNDEIGDLAKSFKAMTTKLKVSRDQIEEYNKTLEKKIAQRTSSLRKKELEITKMNCMLEESNQILEESNTKLKELDKEKDEFISVAAHELKTPLTSIRGFAQLMSDDKVLRDKKKLKHYLSLVDNNTARLYNLILDIVDSSRISLGKLTMNVIKINLKKLFDEIKENLDVIIKENKINSEFKLEKGIPRIYADYERLLQVIKNLMINAVHFTPEGGNISFRIKRSGKFAQFEISDDGIGIPKDKQKNLFKRFYQADSSLTRKVQGSGLGLAVSKGLVETMGGKIWFESEEGKGTTFYFIIPIAKK